ncbi:hypothetical protein BV20DRAFT_937859 [Pilatotrama ljubarskyi]|nr:hypothetical protein BV20DRAFT_937859 [Pilatotrama ljubarskyi]
MRSRPWSPLGASGVCRSRLVRPTLPAGHPRAASNSANPYPFPANAHPTPHQIFHLPKSATKADVKARYYDLVRIYHPDSPSARTGGISSETAHARFQAISSAYAVLCGKRPASSLDGANIGEGFDAAPRATYHDLSTAMWRARQRKRAELDVGLDERWKERMMFGAVLLSSCETYAQHPFVMVQAIALFVLQTYTTRTQAISDARHARRTAARADSVTSLDADEARRLSLEAASPASSPDRGPSEPKR